MKKRAKREGPVWMDPQPWWFTLVYGRFFIDDHTIMNTMKRSQKPSVPLNTPPLYSPLPTNSNTDRNLPYILVEPAGAIDIYAYSIHSWIYRSKQAE
jgi:hypothetical protein